MLLCPTGRFEISNCDLFGTLPTELFALPSLVVLDVSSNGLNGTIPEQVGRLNASARELDLSNNQLTGPIPTGFGSLTAMTKLFLHGNPGLTGNMSAIVCAKNGSTVSNLSYVSVPPSVVCDCCDLVL